jgi:DNA repair exonuclease SbcCD ATPase subunit
MTPLYLRLENFFSHRQSEIDFTEFNSALLIGNVDGDYNISNGSGKSAIFEGILWCLFNKSRVAAMDDIIMWGESECSATLIFSHEGNTYKIERRRSRITSTSTIEFDIRDDNGEWVDISGSTSKLTSDEVINRIKFDYKTFVNSAYFRQNDISEFAESDAGKRKEILKSIIDISKWDNYEADAKAKLKEAKREAEILDVLSNDYDDIVLELANCNKLYESSIIDVNRLTKERDDIDKKLESLNYAYNEKKKNINTKEWDELLLKIEKSKDILGKEKINHTKLTSLIKTINNEISKLERDLAENVKDQNAIILIDNDEKLLENLRRDITTYKADISSSKDRLAELNNVHIIEGECHTCKSIIDEKVHAQIVNEYNERLSSNKRIYIFAKNKLMELNDKLKTYEKSVRDRRQMKLLEDSKVSIDINIKIKKDSLSDYTDSINESIKVINNAQESINMNTKIIDSLKDNDFNNLKQDIILSKDRKKVVLDELSKASMNMGVYQEKVNSYEVRLDSLKDSKWQLAEKIKRIEVLLKISKMFGKNGIQTILLNSVIRDLENTSNKLLSTICTDHFEIIIETQRVGSDGFTMIDTLDLRVKKDGVIQHFKSLSGGEKFRVSLAIRIALSEISSRHGGSSLEFLLLDEINSPLDRHGIETLFVNVIRSLEDRYKIMIITHDDGLKEKFDHIFDVTKSNNESSIKFISV